jgi:hypothetical protein
MGTINYRGFRAQANRTVAALRAGQRSLRLHLSARRPERPKPGGPSLAAADAHTAAMDFQRKLAELTGKMLRKKLFMVTFTSKVGMAELFPLLPAHLEYMITLARKGVLFASAP